MPEGTRPLDLNVNTSILEPALLEAIGSTTRVVSVRLGGFASEKKFDALESALFTLNGWDDQNTVILYAWSFFIPEFWVGLLPQERRTKTSFHGYFLPFVSCCSIR